MCLKSQTNFFLYLFYLLVTEQSPELILGWTECQELCVLSGHWECSVSLGIPYTNPIHNVYGCVLFLGGGGKAAMGRHWKH